MPLQNRADPFGTLHAVASRGTMTGNRGILHDPATRRLNGRRWTSKAWIICVCDFRGRRRDVMGRNGRDGGAGWTELFFLDEVTALGAGHRPCFFCRRDKAKVFLDLAPGGLRRVGLLDEVLHGERYLSSGRFGTQLDRSQMRDLPDGAMVTLDGRAYSMRAGAAHLWSFDGWMPPDRAEFIGARLLTPATTVEILRKGYAPDWHPRFTSERPRNRPTTAPVHPSARRPT